jgi:hypothetical protein
MNSMGRIDILLVEDSPEDVEMTLRAFKKQNLINKVLNFRGCFFNIDIV